MKRALYKFAVITFAALLISGCAAQGPYFKLDTSLLKDIKTFRGTEYVPLVRICDVYKLSWKYDDIIRQATIERRGNKVVLIAGSDRIMVNGVERKLDRPVIVEGAVLMVPMSFARNAMPYVMAGGSAAPEVVVPERGATIRTIVLDAGHGGKDAGAVGRTLKLREKDVALLIVKRLKGLLEENNIRVILTRDNDTFISLARRSEIANRSQADLFISVHINAARNRRVMGFECYHLSSATDDRARAVEAAENSSLSYDDATLADNSRSLEATIWDMTLTENRIESSELAKFITDSITDSGAFNRRKVKTARFYVLKHTQAPSVLLELGYISNRYEESKLRDPKFLDRITDAVAQGILNYKKEYERTEGRTR